MKYIKSSIYYQSYDYTKRKGKKNLFIKAEAVQINKNIFVYLFLFYKLDNVHNSIMYIRVIKLMKSFK